MEVISGFGEGSLVPVSACKLVDAEYPLLPPFPRIRVIPSHRVNPLLHARVTQKKGGRVGGVVDSAEVRMQKE